MLLFKILYILIKTNVTSFYIKLEQQESIKFFSPFSNIILFVFQSQQPQERLKSPKVESKAAMTSPCRSWTKTKVCKSMRAFPRQNITKPPSKWEKCPLAQGTKNKFKHTVVLVMSGTKKWVFTVPDHILLKHSLKPMMCCQGYQCIDLAY